MRVWIRGLLPRKHLWVAPALLLAGLLVGYWLGAEERRISAPSFVDDADASAAVGETDADSVYVCPMLCVPPRENPGDCPICGMTLTATPRGDKSAVPRLTLAPETVKLAQIRTAPVERRFVSAEVRLFGQIAYDPVHISYASAYVPGVIDRIYVEREGMTVRWGVPLFDIRSPEILIIQEQLVDALKLVPGFYSLDQSKPHIRSRTEILLDRPGDLHKSTPEQKKALETINAIRHKLTLIGMEKKDIDELMKKGEPSGIATIYAQRSGIVIEQNAFAGTFVNTGAPVFAIASPKFVWAKLEAYEADYAWIRRGQTARFVTDTFPGETFTGRVVSIDPVFDTKSRTFSVGVIFPDSAGRLRPSMYVRAVIHARLDADGQVVGDDAGPEKAPLVIPASAPLITGKRAVVYVALPGETAAYEGREVLLGPRAKEEYILLGGLREGDQVVINGNFKIDSQVQIMAKSSLMTLEGGTPADAHHHGGGVAGQTDAQWRLPQSAPAGEDMTAHDPVGPAAASVPGMEPPARTEPPEAARSEPETPETASHTPSDHGHSHHPSHP